MSLNRYAPEAVNYGTFSHASDVWSFGVTLWEMFTFGDQPYEDMTGAQVVTYLEKGGRLPRPDGCPAHIYDVMNECWRYKAEDRVTFKRLLTFFNDECSRLGETFIHPSGTLRGTSA